MQTVPLPPHAFTASSHAVGYGSALKFGNPGTLAPGQFITVNKHIVTVERYLSQGGYAHVYVVTTSTPIRGATHHVLKRIAVPDEAALQDVRKEVEIMRLLKGHPNIVHLIDASWTQHRDGTYEVFILMEFCTGGGIIDMMNRRLQERLTESEILQIFVDVCEAVAAMHLHKPALIHRDLKVENILQSSATSFKLCDFGSTAAVATRHPSTMSELKSLEADLNKHTTLQYRAPEMVDVYSRRPINEKSDIWALGVLLFKLCYYTTPFEEHGHLAILNVRYTTPSYPVYSQHMNSLISSMLQEHGSQRPTVFELLATVHALRGSKPLFHYSMPDPIMQRSITSELNLRKSGSAALDAFIPPASPIPRKSPHSGPYIVNTDNERNSRSLKTSVPIRQKVPNGAAKPRTNHKSNDQNPWVPKNALIQPSPLATGSLSKSSDQSTFDQISQEDRPDSFTDSFGESFGATRPKSVTPSGFADSFVPQKARTSGREPKGSSRQDVVHAFNDIDVLKIPSILSSGSNPSPIPANRNSMYDQPSINSVQLLPKTRVSPSPASLLTQFIPVEERFPAIEALDQSRGRDTFSPQVGSFTLRLSPIEAASGRGSMPNDDSSTTNSISQVSSNGSGSRIELSSLTKTKGVVPSRMSYDLDPGGKKALPTNPKPLLQKKHRSSTTIKSSPLYPTFQTAKSVTKLHPALDATPSSLKNRQNNSDLDQVHESSPERGMEKKPYVFSAFGTLSIAPGPSDVTSDLLAAQTTLREKNTLCISKDSSSDESGPEDPAGVTSRAKKARDQASSRNGRPSSVHDLANFYDRDQHADVESLRIASSPTSPKKKPISTAYSDTDPSSSTSRTRARSFSKPTLHIQTQTTDQNMPSLVPFSVKSKGRPRSLLLPRGESQHLGLYEKTSPKIKPYLSSRRNSVTALVGKYEYSTGSTGLTSPMAMNEKTENSQLDLRPSTTSLNPLAPASSALTSEESGSTKASYSSAPGAPNIPNKPIFLRHQTTPKPLPEPNRSQSSRVQPPTLMSLLEADVGRSRKQQREDSPERPFQGVGRLIQHWQERAQSNA